MAGANSGTEQAVNCQTKTHALWHPHCCHRLQRSRGRGQSIEFVPLLWSLSVHEAGVEMIRPTCSIHRANYVKPSHNSLLIGKFHPSCEITPTGEWSMFNILKNPQNKLAWRLQAYGCHVLEAPSNLCLLFCSRVVFWPPVSLNIWFNWRSIMFLAPIISLDLTLRIASWFAYTIVSSKNTKALFLWRPWSFFRT